VDRLSEGGRHSEAIAAARALLERAQAAGDSAYDRAAYDIAMAHFTLGRPLRKSGAAEDALEPLETARRLFQAQNEERMASAALKDKADCLRDLGRLDEAADAYQRAIAEDQKRGDLRDVAVGEGQLATVRRLQKRYDEALTGWAEARDRFERLGDTQTVATAWHQIGMVHQETGHYDAAERAYQESLRIKAQTGNRAGEGTTLIQLGNLYARMGRTEETVEFYRRAADLFADLKDLRYEGVARGNAALLLIQLQRYAEARRELLRAIECDQHFGHGVEPWKTFDILSRLERATGNPEAAAQARQQALEAYLAYRRDGGVSQRDNPELFTAVSQAIAAGQRAAVEQLLADPDLNYRDAAEIILLLDRQT
jgi:tetratricopeptide (TPR) repeat protein